MEILTTYWIYFIYSLIPIFYFFQTAIHFLERFKKHPKILNPITPFKRGIYALFVIFVTYLVDKFKGEQILEIIPINDIPRICLQIVLLPIVGFILSKIFGAPKAPSLKKHTKSKKFNK